MRVFAEHFRIEVELGGRRTTHDHQVDVVTHELLDRLLPVADVQLQLYARVSDPERGDHLRREVLGGADRAEHDLAAGAGADGVDHAAAAGELGLDVRRRVHQFAAGVGAAQPVGSALEQGHTGGAFEQPQLLRDGRRSDVQGLRGAGDGAGGEHRGERSELLERDVAHVREQ